MKRVCVRKTREEVDNTTLVENLSHVTCSDESDQIDKLKQSEKKVEREPESAQHQNFIVIEPKGVRMDPISKKEVATTRVSGCHPCITFPEQSTPNRKETVASRHQNPIIDESTRIRISQTSEKFSTSKVNKFEASLSSEKCFAVQLSQEMGFRVENSGSGMRQKTSVQETEKNIYTTAMLENLPFFTFSGQSKRVLADLLEQYPPGDGELWRTMIEAFGDTTDRTEEKEDDVFRRPCMSKVEITKRLEILSEGTKDSFKLKLINEKRSKLPITSFKDMITSTVESHQVVMICGETGCGKTTQVPQYILDHMWGKGEVCKIICTQLQSVSAISVSKRISSERGEVIGNDVGYKVQFESEGGRHSSIVLCTPGVLLKALASTSSHFSKRQHVQGGISNITHIIMDEIHERESYSDLMLAILREILPSNPHLRLILMSGSFDATRFSQYFGACPIIYVPGLTYPVKNYYLEDVLSIVKSGADNHGLSQVEKLSLDEAIHLAWSNDAWCSLLELVYSKARPKVFDYQHSLTGLNPLMVFAGKGKVGDMCMLLSLGANCHLKAKDGTTALEIAEKEHQPVAVELLKKHMNNDFSVKEEKNLLDKYLATANLKDVDVVLIEQLLRKICVDSKDGSIIVFLPGWDEIVRTRERLLSSSFFNKRSKFKVVSLHSMVLASEMNEAFMPAPHGCRKIVLSTNIAETAVPLDDLVYVIDTGLIKEKSYDPCKNLFTLQSSWISKASAKKREGCASRCHPGACYHLYSKVQADSLLDFQDPEIKRMPIEELCLQVKLFDPTCKIEEFLSQTLDPPGFESIRSAARVLQEIGALSVDEHLTELGQKFGYLPVHPYTSRMLIFSILMNCLDPALTLACASKCKDLFVLPILPDEKKRAAAARSELASLYGGCGDQFSIIAAYQCWVNSKKMGLESRFCSQYFVSQSAMSKLDVMRKNLAAELYRNGLINRSSRNYCSNAYDPGILQAVLVAGMYPMVGKLFFPYGSGKKILVNTKSIDSVCLNSHTLNYKLSSQKILDCSFVVYDEITSIDRGLCIGDSTTVGLFPLFLLSKEIDVDNAKDCTDNIITVIIDGWLYFESTAFDAFHMNYLRELLTAAIIYKVTYSTDVLSPVLQAAVDSLACILSCHGRSCISLISDCAMKQTTTNATNTKKFQTQLINQDAHQTSPSQVKASEPEAIENSINQTSKNARIGLACSNPTKKTVMTLEGFCTGLINHNDVPSRASKFTGAEKPRDPTRRNTETGSARSIQTAHLNDDVTMTDVRASRQPHQQKKYYYWHGACYEKIWVGWSFPEVGWIKANVDGSYKLEEHLTSCGGVFRDHTGSWCFGFTLNLGTFCFGSSDPTSNDFSVQSELWGVLTALKLAKEKKISQLWIESDSVDAVDCVLNKRAEKHDLYTPLVQSILELIEGNWKVRISHSYREGNQVADWLSKYGHSKEIGLRVYDAPPKGVKKLLIRDYSGVSKQRYVRLTAR
ncbi:DExH-box ATP-dependent RNA helicase DExH6 isoform X4 [Vigna angularis]|uniref:DExH-box ATP-dependent RNA helicase DExH6 isoform X4 n=1 Tax=Phaseolus angularis TaxID=3914 RepID=UPI00080A3433|nr:DExH-box ATP-dependent RNA helicase DExH6 isoform X4 [Vigna angularis]